jgi:hypothetical protein
LLRPDSRDFEPRLARMIQDTIPHLPMELFLGLVLVAEYFCIAHKPEDPNDSASDQRPDTTKCLHGLVEFSA